MNKFNISLKHFPIVLVTLYDNLTNENVQELMDIWKSLYLEKKDFYFIFNTIDSGRIELKHSFTIAYFIKKMKTEPIQYLKRSIIIIDKSMTFERGIIKLIFSIQSPSAPVYIADTTKEGLELHTKLLNNEIPKDIIYYT